MVDLVRTCPKDFWLEWVAEADAAGDPETGGEWSWYADDPDIRLIRPGDRFYVVAHGKLRGWTPVVWVEHGYIVYKGSAVACTIDERIRGFNGLRARWWLREIEKPFPDWRAP